MNLSLPIRRSIIAVASYAYIILFLYAAVSKLLDFENFRVQLGQSPMLSAFAGILAWSVPVVEIGLSFALMVPGSRLIGLFGAYILMVLFTAYIFILLTLSDHVPCSCGGILEALGWTEHIIFNAGFLILAMAAILFYPASHKTIRI